ncbi:MAG: PD-(D/E)XK nuclease family protein [Actinomycetota bacterium]
MTATEELAKVTLAHLRDPEDRCARRLEKEHGNETGHRGSTLRFAISNRLEQAALLAQATAERPRAVHFPTPTDLPVESQRVFDAAVRWYLTVFGERTAVALDEGDFVTARPDLGVRLAGRVGLRFEGDAGPEVRILHYAGRDAVPTDVARAPEVRFALLRHADWARRHDGPILVTVADVLRGEATEARIDAPAALADCDEWLVERLARIRARLVDPRPSPGTQCAWCPFIGSCPAFR